MDLFKAPQQPGHETGDTPLSLVDIPTARLLLLQSMKDPPLHLLPLLFKFRLFPTFSSISCDLSIPTSAGISHLPSPLCAGRVRIRERRCSTVFAFQHTKRGPFRGVLTKFESIWCSSTGQKHN